MPRRPKRPCNWPGCNTLLEGGYCEKHKPIKRRYPDNRLSARVRGYTDRWDRYSIAFIAAHPLCAQCAREGIDSPTAVTDHIVAVSGPDDPLFWKESNHQGLCRDCHEVKHGRMRRDSDG